MSLKFALVLHFCLSCLRPSTVLEQAVGMSESRQQQEQEQQRHHFREKVSDLNFKTFPSGLKKQRQTMHRMDWMASESYTYFYYLVLCITPGIDEG
jgi:hypothetical protein